MPDGLDHTLPLLLSCHSNAAFVCLPKGGAIGLPHCLALIFLPAFPTCFLWALPDLAQRKLWANTYFFWMITENFKHSLKSFVSILPLSFWALALKSFDSGEPINLSYLWYFILSLALLFSSLPHATHSSNDFTLFLFLPHFGFLTKGNRADT